MSDILRRGKALGLQFEDEGTLRRLSELQELLHDAKHRRAVVDDEGEDSTIEDEIVSAAEAEIQALLRKRR